MGYDFRAQSVPTNTKVCQAFFTHGHCEAALRRKCWAADRSSRFWSAAMMMSKRGTCPIFAFPLATRGWKRAWPLRLMSRKAQWGPTSHACVGGNFLGRVWLA